MWKGTWSNSNPSQTSNGRNFSPAPQARRRPQLTPRSSSLNLGALNASTASLSGAGQRTASGYTKRGSAQAPPTGLKDPLEVLAAILGTQNKASVRLVYCTEGFPYSIDLTSSQPKIGVGEGTAAPQLDDNRPASVDDEIDFDGLSLEEFAAKEDIQKWSYNAQPVEDCMSGLAVLAVPYC